MIWIFSYIILLSFKGKSTFADILVFQQSCV